MINYQSFNSQGFTIPIFYQSDSPALDVQINIMKPFPILTGINDGIEYYADQVGHRSYNMGLQPVKLGDKYTYIKLLSSKELQEVGSYIGNIVATRKDGTEVHCEPFTILLQESILSTVKNGLTIGDMISSMYNYTYFKPTMIPVGVNACDVSFPYSHSDKVVLFRNTDGSWLESGAVYTVLRISDKLQAYPVNGYYRQPVMVTDARGYSIAQSCDEASVDITRDNKPASFCILSCLPVGEYKIFAEYIKDGRPFTTPYQSIKIK